MKWFCLVIILILFSGCSKGKEAVKEADEIVKDYARGLVKVPKKIRILTEIASLRQAVEVYRIDNGQYPDKLTDLTIRIDNPDEYIYDPKTGKLKSKHYPNL